MPFTPFHLGPGAAFKSLGGEYFSLTVFAIAQVAMDFEVLVNMFRAHAALHTTAHTYLGASGLGLILAIFGKPIGEMTLRVWNWRLNPDQQELLGIAPHIPWTSAVLGAFIGTYSHVLLDSIMHADMHPWAPFFNENEMLGFLSLDRLHGQCIGAGVCGVLILRVRAVWYRYVHRNSKPLNSETDPSA